MNAFVLANSSLRLFDGRRCLDHIREIGHLTAVLARRVSLFPVEYMLYGPGSDLGPGAKYCYPAHGQ